MVNTRSQTHAISSTPRPSTWTFIKRNEQQIADFIQDFEAQLEKSMHRTLEPDWGIPGPFEVNFDFDESISEWNSNKKRVGHSYEYVCGHILKNGRPCQNKRSHYVRCRLHHKHSS